MTDPTNCPHRSTVSVDVRDHDTGGTRTVARICTKCLAQLEPRWGCTDCEWESFKAPRRLCDPHTRTQHTLIHPCEEHA